MLPHTLFIIRDSFIIKHRGFRYNIMEKVQMTGFFCQEMIMSSIYLIETFKLLHMSLQADTRTTMRQLAAVHLVIIV